jgi:hypothetical protein
MRIFDYKFIIILGMSLVIYFLYRDIEKLSNKVTQLENNYYKSLESFNNDEETVDINYNNSIIELPMPINDIQLPMPINDNQNDDYNVNNDVTINDIELPLPINNNQNDDYNEEQPDDDYNEEYQDDDEAIDNNQDDIIEEYSQDNDCDQLIYSNDNEDNATSAVESIINLNKVSENEENVDDLLKNNKLGELQEMAQNLGIDIVNIETSKKKTKLQLAQDIITKKNL